MVNKSSGLLTKEDMQDHERLPDWLVQEYKTFEKTVLDPTFPCYFGMKGQRKGELRYAYISQKDWSNLPQAVGEFLALFKSETKIKHGLFLFVEPFEVEQELDHYRAQFWEILQYLHEQDEKAWPEEHPRDPDHFLWDFHFDGEPIFVFGNAPAYKQRKTRNLGNAMVLGFQPRAIFQGLEGTEKGGIMSREKVRERVEKWDQLPKHPDISHYGDPDHHEWKQSFIGDDINPVTGKCPFQHKELVKQNG
ncbi:YqcI/YcgG family protein [Jeotgalibacillus aurantiacus]|uniref:YqcI/YcgG family protein n=1 Tax=Jeotgalibacillus aurantiacus TaxID=2763266 RepID=UPI001D0B36FC|nr:YqcI/YcgG family protein [Jeotgalibacillus aurantiacus]